MVMTADKGCQIQGQFMGGRDGNPLNLHVACVGTPPLKFRPLWQKGAPMETLKTPYRLVTMVSSKGKLPPRLLN